MRKIIILSSLVLTLSACGFKASTDFTSLYKSHVHSQISAIEETAKTLGLYRQEQSVGTLLAEVNVPMMVSGSIALEHEMKVNGRDADIALKNLRVAYESLMGSGSLSLERFGLISKSGDAYFSFAGLQDTLLPEDARAVLAKYEKTWLSWTKDDMRKTLSGASEDEILANTIVENLSKMTLDDLEKYLTEYPIFANKSDLGMSGSLHVFAVDLDRTAVTNLVADITKDLTGSGMTDAQKQDIQNGLAGLSFSGTIAFDPNNAKTVETHLLVSESGSALVGSIDVVSNELKTQVRIASAATNAGIDFTLAKDGSKNTLNLSVFESGAELGKLSGYVTKDGDKFQELSLEATTQGMTVSLKHTLHADGKFEGTLQLPIVGAITWNGTLSAKKLTALSLKGNTPSGSVSMELTPVGDRVTGPLTIKQGSELLFSANVSLLLDEGKFGLGFDILPTSTGSTETQVHAAVNVTNSSSPFDGSISVPTGVKPLQNLLDELDKLMPADAFVPEADSEMMLDSTTSDN